MSDVVRPALSALERAEVLLTVLNREHTSAELYSAVRGIRHEVRSARDLLQAFGRDVTAQLPGKVGAGAPETSQAAARAIRTRSGSQRHTLLRELRGSDLTDFQLQRDTGIVANSERPRRLELLEAGYIASATGVDGKRVTRPHPHSGLDCQVWTITEKGRNALSFLESGQQVLAYGEGRMPWELEGDTTVPEQFVPTR